MRKFTCLNIYIKFILDYLEILKFYIWIVFIIYTDSIYSKLNISDNEYLKILEKKIKIYLVKILD